MPRGPAPPCLSEGKVPHNAKIKFKNLFFFFFVAHGRFAMVVATPLLCGAACGLRHSAAVTETGEVWAWGTVHGLPPSEEHRWSLEPKCVGGVELFGCRAVAVAAGASHTVAGAHRRSQHHACAMLF